MATFLNIIKSIIFGIVEGITEWLPISSTGHLILLDEFMGMDYSEQFFSVFEVVIQLGAILAVIVIFFRKLNPFSPDKSKTQKRASWELWAKVLVATVPAAVIGFLLDDWMDEHLYNAWVVAAALIIYGVAFIVIERVHAARNIEPRITSVQDIGYADAAKIGCFQMLALVPGTSRSGSTILGSMILRLSRETAAEFSFFMAIPVMLGASLLKLAKFALSGNIMSVEEIAVLLIASAVAFIVSMLAIRFLMNFVKRHSFEAFGVYRIALGLVVIIYFVIKLTVIKTV